MQKNIEKKMKKLERLYCSATSTTAALREDVVSGGSGENSKMEEYLDLKREICCDFGKLHNLKVEINHTIENLETDLYKICYLRYIELKTWNYIARKMGKSRQWVYNKHDQAIKLLEVYTDL